MQVVLRELEGEEDKQYQTEDAQHGVGQVDNHAHGDEIIIQAR